MPGEHHDTFREWLYLEADGGLRPGERGRLRRHLGECAECRTVRGSVEGLHRLLAASRIEVREEFTRKVLADLPPAGWEGRNPRSWIAAAALFVALLGAAAGVALLGGSQGQAVPSAVGALAAVADLFRSTLLAGAGLLTASWQGVGLAIRELFGDSILSVLAFGVLVLGLDVLFVRLLVRAARARRRALEPVAASGEPRQASSGSSR